VNEMIKNGINEFIEVGPGNTLQGLIRKINPEVIVSKI
jgi:[acyl-carrier-protein] S-malonyltransferase